MKTIIHSILMAWLALLSLQSWSQAYLPKDDAEVLEVLPVTLGERKQLKDLRNQVNGNPGDYRPTLRLAESYIALGRLNSDPRYYGYAEAVLVPWLRPQQEQADALVLRATILQNRHDFQSALADLKLALQLNPRLAQAWLTQAAIYEVQGDYSSALSSCLALARISASLATTTCVNSALSLSGQAQPSYAQLVEAVADVQVAPEELVWTYAVLAELAERLNFAKEAERWYQQALDQGQRSVYLLASYADYLLNHNRANEVIGLLHNETKTDPLLLRLALAEQQMHHVSANQHIDLIKTKIAAAKTRGDNAHQGDEARFFLHVLNDPETALKLAIDNWAVQKEPRDAQILLEAAIAAKRPEAAIPVVKFLEQTRLEDARLQPLVKLAGG
jgi:tetratricopeptide (TPR) repeat protein